MSSHDDPDEPGGAALLDAILADEERDRIPGARPVVSAHPDDDPEFLAAVRGRARSRVPLRRRGVEHGEVVELEARPREVPLHVLRRRWRDARPILLPRQLAHEAAGCALPAEDRARLLAPGGLDAWLAEHAERWSGSFELTDEAHALGDPERDLAARVLRPRTLDAPAVWLKSARLSTHADDASLRVRLGFGREVDDDAATDPRGHAAVRRLAECLLPSARVLRADEDLVERLAEVADLRPVPSQHILYWNAPGGGARFHHDAFGQPERSGQRGVAYFQVSGATLWLALATRDLARALAEFAQVLADGELGHVRDACFPGDAFPAFLALAADERACAEELALPGCGTLAALVDLTPEFTAFLADRGHALRVEAGDVLLLPNHGYARTVMHSVFCASEEPGEALSVALREA